MKNNPKVLYKLWIPVKYNDTLHVRMADTGCFQKDFVNEGVFMGWGSACEESTAGFGNYSVALVRTKDGTVEEVLPRNIKFI